MDFLKTDQLTIGPGQYFQSNDKNYIKKRIHPPFQTSSQRNTYIQNKDNPGPGSYDLIDKKETTYNTSNINNLSSIIFNSGQNNSDMSKKTRNKNTSNIFSENNNDHLINAYDNKKNNNNKKIGFLSQVIRFDHDKILEKSDAPGPGSYEILNNNILTNQEKSKINKKLVNQSLTIGTGSLKRIVSIPSKDMNGYIMNNKNKTLNLVIDKTSNLSKKASTSEFIGPGKYDINLSKKIKGTIEWDKGFNINDINHKKEILKRKKTLEEMKQNGDIIFKSPSNKMFFSKICKDNNIIQGRFKKGLYDLNTKLFANNINKKNNYFLFSRDSFIEDKNEVPGPGYYTKEFSKNYYEKKIFKKTYEGGFGSGSKRFLYKSKSMQDLGPTTYFAEKNKYELEQKLDRLNIFNHLKNSKISGNIEHNSSMFEEINKKYELPSPGPGTYELSNSFINKTFGKCHLMDNNLIRFKPKINLNPGPGSYDKDIKDFVGNNYIKKNIKKINILSNKEKGEKMKKILESIKHNKKLEIPGVGSYNNDFIESMYYKIKKGYNPKISDNSPFLMSSGRFKYKYDKVDSYVYEPYKEDKSVKNKQYMVFGKSPRFLDNENKNWEAVGPGSYNLDKNSWNIKTYNRLFS